MSRIRIYRKWFNNGWPKVKKILQHNQLHGTIKWWYDNKQLKHEIPYKNNKCHGTSRGWHKNGQLKYEVPRENGKRHGIERDWYENGTLRSEHYYLYDKQTTEEEYRKHILIESLACLK